MPPTPRRPQQEIVAYSHANETCFDRNRRLGMPDGRLCGQCERNRKAEAITHPCRTCGEKTTILRLECLPCDLTAMRTLTGSQP